MLLSEIRQKVRNMLDDNAKRDTHRYWTNAEIDEYINACIEEMCERTQCVTDSLTDSVCLITLVANQRHYPLNSAILDIKTVQPSWQDTPLARQSVATAAAGWLSDVGLPNAYLLNYSDGYISLTSAPSTVTTETLRLSTARLPISELVAEGNEPDIPRQYHRKLFNGVLGLAYDKQDSELYNPAKAKGHRERWDNDLSTIVRRTSRLKPRIIVARSVEMS